MRHSWDFPRRSQRRLGRGKPRRAGCEISGKGGADNVMSNEKRAFAAYLCILAALGGSLVLAATSTMGPGISTDAAQVMSAAENLMRGRGLVEYSGKPLTQFPPLYSLILAAVSYVLHADVLDVGRYLNAVVFAGVIWFSGIYLRRALEDEPVLAWFGSLVILTSTSLLEISANIASDPLFLLLVVFFLMSASEFLRGGALRFAALAAALATISCFQRYAGLSLVLAGGLIAAYAFRQHVGKALAAASLFVVVTGVPIVLWGLLHNQPVNGTVFGARLPPLASGNLASAAEKVLYWFIPYRVISGLGPIGLLQVVMGVLALTIAITGARGFVERLRRPEIVPNIAFLLVYMAVLVFNISYSELKGLKVDRVHIIMLPALLMVLFAVGARVLQAGGRKFGSGPFHAAAVVAVLLWSTYPISKTSEYVRASMAFGDVSSYNSINKGYLRESPLAAFLGALDLQERQVFTNGLDTVWLLTRTDVHAIPILTTEARESELHQRFEHWPDSGGEGYVVWLYSEAYKPHYATPEELESIADLERIYSDERAVVYLARDR